MDMKGDFRIGLPQAAVWEALNDPKVLKASIPGCEELERESETVFRGRIAAAVGPVRAKFSGQATLSDIDAPNGYTLTGNGSGGAAGMVKGGATVRLVPEGQETVLHYEAHAQVAGKLAQIGSRLVDMAAKKMADEFFGNFVAQLGPPEPAGSPQVPPEATPAAPGVDLAAAPAPAAPPSEIVSPRRRGWLVWVLAAVAVLILAAHFIGLY